MQSDGLALPGLYFVGQKDCPDVGVGAPMRPERFDPKAGEYQGQPIRKLKVVRPEEQSADLFPFENSAIEGAAPVHARPVSSMQASAASGQAPGHKAMPRAGQAGGGTASALLALMQTDTPAAAMALFEQTQAEMREYFEGKRQVFDMLLRPQGTKFQQKVWQALLQIPYGKLVSYGDIAREAGLSSGHGRAVGTAVGRNPLTIIVPCHRVVSRSGTLTGYSGGLDRKLALLQLEGFSLS
jgi:methylated-DNA-[protein]-cysteine S-methyltransferase